MPSGALDEQLRDRLGLSGRIGLSGKNIGKRRDPVTRADEDRACER
jgi:hypothetical protein